MKIWLGYGSEHSSNLVIIGKFDKSENAQQALNLLNEAASVAIADEQDGLLSAGKVSQSFSDRQMDFFRRTNISFNYGDPEQFLYEFHPTQEGANIVITTEELEINAFLKILIHQGAKVELYSAHAHKSPYGRQTNQGQ